VPPGGAEGGVVRKPLGDARDVVDAHLAGILAGEASGRSSVRLLEMPKNSEAVINARAPSFAKAIEKRPEAVRGRAEAAWQPGGRERAGGQAEAGTVQQAGGGGYYFRIQILLPLASFSIQEEFICCCECALRRCNAADARAG